MTKIYCENCGSNQLEERGETYYCPHCRTTWRKHEIDEVYDKLASILDEQKQERVANLRHQLYDALNEENIVSADIIRICNEIRGYLPEDFQAKFFMIASKNGVQSVAKTLRQINPSLHMGYVPQIMDFMLKTLQSGHLAALNDFLDRAYGGGRDGRLFDHYNGRLQEEAQKVEAGVYDPSIPRDVFVAYASADRRKLLELVDALESNGLKCFVAMRNMQHFNGENLYYQNKLEKAMNSCKIIVFVSSVKARTDSDAYRIELPYVKMRDLQAHPEYQNCYERMPSKFKKPRIEYIIEDHKGLPAEQFAREFFTGFERMNTPEQVVNAVYRLKDSVVIDDEPKKDVKYCVNCGAECPQNAKFCLECGKNSFVDTYEEYKEGKKKSENDAIAQKLAQMQAQLEAAEKARLEAEAKAKQVAEQAERKTEEVHKAEETHKAEEERRVANPYTVIDEKHIAFGYYPQRKVKDSNLIAELKRLTGPTPFAGNSEGWADYKYYIEKQVQSFMWYKDVNYGGEKYRAVYFDKWRPKETDFSSSEDKTEQSKNGFKHNTIYWFKWEPIKWKILQKSSGDLTLFSEMLIDSQHYYRTYKERIVNGKTIYTNNYAQSDIRAWLNKEFYNAAFTDQEKCLIKTTLVDNSVATLKEYSTKYTCENTYDKIYLLSYKEANSYGFNNDLARRLKTTDYAQAQGAFTYAAVGYAGYWWLRSPYSNLDHCAISLGTGGDSCTSVDRTNCGVAPALQIDISNDTFDSLLKTKSSAKSSIGQNSISTDKPSTLQNYDRDAFEMDGTILEKYNGKGGKVYIPEGVTEIYGKYEDSAFCNREDITSVIIPNSVTKIGEYAFKSCKGLTSITIPNGVTSIGGFAFYECGGLTSVNIPESVTSIGSDAFHDCTGLTSISIPNSLTSIGHSAFWGCSSLKSITIPNGVKNIEYLTFYSCTGLTSITIPNSVTCIEGSAFCGCSGLTSINIPNGVTKIRIDTFCGCSGLTSITIPNSVTNIEENAFASCSGLKSINISNSVTDIGKSAFYGCKALTSIIIPNSVTYIWEKAFDNCDKLTNVTIPKRFDTGFLHKKLKEIFGDSYKHIQFTFTE